MPENARAIYVGTMGKCVSSLGPKREAEFTQAFKVKKN